MISINVSSGVFANEAMQPLTATIGQPFSLDISSVFAGSDPVDILVSIVSITSWLSYHSQNFIFAGDVSDSATASSITVTLRGNTNISLSKRATDTKSFTINIYPPPPAGLVPTSAIATLSAALSSTSEITLAGITQLANSSKGITKLQLSSCCRAECHSNSCFLASVPVLETSTASAHRKGWVYADKKNISRPQLLDPPALLISSSSDSGTHPALRSPSSGFNDDTSIYNHIERERRSISMPKPRRSIINMASDFWHRPLRRSISDNYITYGMPSLPSTYTQDNSTKAGTAQTKDNRRTSSEWRYQPCRTFGDESVLRGSIQIKPGGPVTCTTMGSIGLTNYRKQETILAR